MKRLIAVITVSIFLFNFMLVPAQIDTSSELNRAKVEEQKLVLELLNLEVERLKTQKFLENLMADIENLAVVIQEKSKEIQIVSKEIEKEKEVLKTWFRFLYMDGANAILSLLLMAQNSSELLHRLIYIDIITNYFYNKLDNLNKLVKYKKEEENRLTSQRLQLIEKQKEQIKLLKKIDELRLAKSQMLEEIKIKIANYQKIFTLADNLDKMFPSLDYLLSHLSQLPWDTLEYKDLRFSFFDISASFSDADVTKMICSYSNKLKNITVSFSKEGFEIKDDDSYTLKGNFGIEDNKIKLLITSLNIGDIKINDQLLQKILYGYDTTINIKIPVEGFKLKKVKTEEGYVKFTLQK
ncbi:coiled-coil domain-containing protein [Thermoanaerobacter mathranii]|uniref:coiled-coil domain-containing protein n=1 Tax=Thermoanaerobacter mathranii TaxID=583357 RepID=UPI003D6BAFD0